MGRGGLAKQTSTREVASSSSRWLASPRHRDLRDRRLCPRDERGHLSLRGDDAGLREDVRTPALLQRVDLRLDGAGAFGSNSAGMVDAFPSRNAL